MIDTDQITHELPGVTVQLTHASAGHVVLNLIRVDESQRGNGHAHAAMQRLCDQADAQGLTLALSPEPFAGDRKTSKARLTRWYASYGFRPNKGRARDYAVTEPMIRTPR